MAACTFFGHRDCPETVKPKLREVLVDLITNRGVDMFYVGHQGQFDAMVRSVLQELKKAYPNYFVDASAFIKRLNKIFKSYGFSEIIIPRTDAEN